MKISHKRNGHHYLFFDGAKNTHTHMWTHTYVHTHAHIQGKCFVTFDRDFIRGVRFK